MHLLITRHVRRSRPTARRTTLASSLAILALALSPLAAVGASPTFAARQSVAARQTLAAGAASATAAAAPAAPLDLGVQYHGLWSDQSPATRRTVLDRLAAHGVEWVRIDLSWAMIEPTKGRYDMAWGVPFVDTVLKEADARGLKILVTFWQTPAWANGGRGERAAATRPADFGRAAGWAAARWGRTVDAWEIWNEQNVEGFFTGANPSTYTRLLCAAYPQMKAKDRSPVLFGGLQYNDAAFVKKAYAAGARGCFDALATHPYSAPADAQPAAFTGPTWGIPEVAAVRKVMVAQGDQHKKIWFTEMGWSTGRSPGAPPWDRGVTERTQARNLTESVRLIRSKYPYVRTMIWFRERDRTTGDVHEDRYGLLRPNLAPKPALVALKKASESLR